MPPTTGRLHLKGEGRTTICGQPNSRVRTTTDADKSDCAKCRKEPTGDMRLARARGYSLTELDNGKVKVRVQLPFTPDGKRQQQMRTFDTKDEGEAWALALKATIVGGTHRPVAKDTFNAVADAWLLTREDKGLRAVSIQGYRVALKPAREAFGHRKIGDIEYADIEALLRSLKSRSKRTNYQTLYCVRATFKRAIKHSMIRDSPAQYAELIGKESVDREPLLPADHARIKAHIVSDRLEAAWLMTLCGMRRSEVLALRWDSFSGDTVSVTGARVDMGPNSLAITAPKSDSGKRTLPLPPEVMAAVRRCRALRMQEHLRRPPGGLEVPWDEGSFIAVDPTLRPITPQTYTHLWTRLMEAAGCEQIVTLHAARHGSVSMMNAAGYRPEVVAAWHGHTVQVSLTTYNHVQQEALREVGEAL